MKKTVLLTLLAGAACAATAQEQGRVLSSTPIVQQVAIPRQVCGTDTVYAGAPNSGAGAVMGAIAGGAIGNSIGGGSGRAAATALGVIGGALVGNQIEGAGQPRYQNVQRCNTETYYENRTVGYNVVYEYGGRQYSAQMPSDPGPTVQLQVSPVGQQAAAPVYAPPVTQTVYTESYPTTTYVSTPPVVYAAPTYYAPSYYPAVTFGLGLGLGYWGGWRGGYHGGYHGGRHWR